MNFEKRPLISSNDHKKCNFYQNVVEKHEFTQIIAEKMQVFFFFFCGSRKKRKLFQRVAQKT